MKNLSCLEKDWQEQYHCLRAREYNLVFLSKKSLSHKLASLPSFNGYLDSVAFYRSMA